MRSYFLNRLSSSILFKLGKSLFVKHCAKRNCDFFEKYCTDLVKKSFFRTVVIFPQIINPQNQYANEKKINSLSLFNLVLNFILVSLIIIFLLTVIFGLFTFYLTTRVLGINNIFPPVLLKVIEFLSPTFHKFGQWLSKRKDIFPEEFCSTLGKLQKYTSSHSWIYTKHLLKATYGPSWKELFVKFDSSTPIGSGCYAQVNVSTVVAELFSAMVRYQVKQDGSFSSVILSIAVIEGLRSSDPDIDMIKELLPFHLYSHHRLSK